MSEPKISYSVAMGLRMEIFRSIRFGGRIRVFAPPPEAAAVNDEATIKPDEESP